MSEQRYVHETFLNVYFDPKTGENRTLYARTRDGARWEREVAIPENWWQEGHLVPAYLLRIKFKAKVKKITAPASMDEGLLPTRMVY